MLKFSLCMFVALLLGALGAAAALACGEETKIFEESEGWGPDNPAAGNVEQSCTGDPINCASGNLTEEQTDLAIGGRGPLLHLTRTYNSQLAAAAGSPGPFGYGWTGPYSAHLTINAEAGTATVHHDNGSTAVFYLAKGVYTPASWIQSTLVKAGETYVYTLPDQSQLEFDTSGRLTEEADRYGNALDLTYSEGKLQSVEDDAGRELTFAYSGAQVKSVEDPLGNKAEYTYESGELVAVSLPEGEGPRWEFDYDGSHRLTKRTDGRGNTTENEYDGFDRVIAQTDPLERERTLAYSETEGLRKTTITEPNGAKTVQKFNAAGEPLEIIQAQGTALQRTTKLEYDGAFALIKLTDPNNHVTTFKYDGAGNLTSEKDAEGNETKWTFDATRDVISTTTPEGETTTIERDGDGNPESISRPGPEATTQEWSFEYAANGDLEVATDPLGKSTSYEYDAYGNLEAEVNPEGDERTWAYDENSQLIAEVSPRGNEEGAEAAEFTTELEPDDRGRLLKLTDPLGHTTEYEYDGNDNVEAVTDGNGHTTEFTYDKANQLTKTKAANGTTTEAAYDPLGLLKSRTNGKGKTTKYERNLLGQVTEEVDPLNRKTTREYDDAGSLEKLKDPKGRTATFGYDKADRLKSIAYSEEATPDVAYEYDKDGNVVAMTDGTGTSEYEYDQLGRLVALENGNSETVEYEYDLGDRQTEITYPNGKAVVQEFDDAARLEKVTDWLGKSTSFAYDRDSQLRTTTFPSGTSNVDTYTYNRAGEMTAVTFAKGEETLASLGYARDEIGQVETETMAGLPGAASTAYEYDEANRLTKAGTTGFEYDNASNPTKLGAASYSYDNASQLEAGGGTSFSFDEIGQRTKATPESGPATNYGYDQAGNLISVDRSASGEVPKVEDDYAYDGSGLRASQTISGTTRHFVWDRTAPLPLLLSDGDRFYLYGPDGLPFAQIAAETPTYLHHDQLGSTRLLTNSAGEAKGAYTYAPYGAIEAHTGSASTPLGYGGQYRNDSTGLIYLRARTYDPVTAQFLSVDPLAAETGETYGYATQNPVNFGDPSGLDTRGICVSLSAEVPVLQGGLSACAVRDSDGNYAIAVTAGAAGGVNEKAVSEALKKWLSDPRNIANLKKLLSTSATFGVQKTDAKSVKDLGGWASYEQWSGGFGVVGSKEKVKGDNGVVGRTYSCGASPGFGWSYTKGRSYTVIIGPDG